MGSFNIRAFKSGSLLNKKNIQSAMDLGKFVGPIEVIANSNMRFLHYLPQIFERLGTLSPCLGGSFILNDRDG